MKSKTKLLCILIFINLSCIFEVFAMDTSCHDKLLKTIPDIEQIKTISANFTPFVAGPCPGSIVFTKEN